MMEIVIWTREGDAYCKEAIRHLQLAKKEFVEKKIGAGFTMDQLIAADPNATAEMPALFVNGKYVGGLREIHGLVRNS